MECNTHDLAPSTIFSSRPFSKRHDQESSVLSRDFGVWIGVIIVGVFFGPTSPLPFLAPLCLWIARSGTSRRWCLTGRAVDYSGTLSRSWRTLATNSPRTWLVFLCVSLFFTCIQCDYPKPSRNRNRHSWSGGCRQELRILHLFTFLCLCRISIRCFRLPLLVFHACYPTFCFKRIIFIRIVAACWKENPVFPLRSENPCRS